MKLKKIWLSIFISIIFLIMAACGNAVTPAPPTPLAPTATLRPTRTTTPTAPVDPALVIGSTQVSPKDGMVMVYVPAGEFLMGSADTDKDAFFWEKPQHTVYMNAYWIDQTEVTNAMYTLCVEAGVCNKPYYDSYSHPKYIDHPVVGVDWYQAQAYCGWAGRWLPIAAEWEKAARGTDGRIYPWGEGIDCKLANYWGKDVGCIGNTQPVGSYPGGASPYGVLDMIGNALEWVADWDDGNDYTDSPGENPLGPGSGTLRMHRGSSWRNEPEDTRVAAREPSFPNNFNNDLGFRCAQ